MSELKQKGILFRLYQILENRRYEGSPEKSYSASLMYKGQDAILKKLGEETTELILAAKNSDHREQVHEISDLCFHLLVLMVYQGIPLQDIEEELLRRMKHSGLEEKAARHRKE